MHIIGWGLMYITLVVLLAAIVVILLPLPTLIRRKLVDLVFLVRHGLYAVAAVSTLLAYQSYVGFAVLYSAETVKEQEQINMMLMMQTKHIRSQRNFYISLMCLTLSLVLIRVASILKGKVQLIDELKELKRIHGSSTPKTAPTTSASDKKNQ